jgi:ATP-binding cassette subfamily B protein
MRTDPGYFEERTLKGSYDRRLLSRLLPFTRPYRVTILVSIGLVMLMTLVDLALPFITKTAIDRYIVPRQAPGVENLKVPDALAGQLKFDLHAPGVESALHRYPEAFMVRDGAAYIAPSRLQQLPKPLQLELRRPHIRGLGGLTLLFLLLVAGNFGLSFAQKMIMEYAGHRMMHDLRMRLFSHIQSLPMEFFTRNPVGRLVTRATNDIQNMHELFTNVLSLIFKDVFLLTGIMAVMLVMNWRLALAAFMVLPLVLYAAHRFAHQVREIFRELRVRVAEINTHFAETISGIKVIQAFRREADNYRRFRKLNHANYLAGMRQIHAMAIFMPIIEVLGISAMAVMIYYGGHQVLRETISLGLLVAFLSYIKMFFRPIRDLSEKYNILQNAMSSAERIFLILDGETPEVQRDPSAASDTPHAPRRTAAPQARIQEIRFDKVSFAYLPNEWVLKDISFSIGPGETLAVVGPTGSGKTTLASLVTRFYLPTRGTIRFNGRDVRDLDPHEVRRPMALVTQEPFLFAGSVRDNILQGTAFDQKNDADQFLDQILEHSNCRGFIERLPQGVDTPLAEGGAWISSGERQLIAIARALARDPELIVLDEATSYIDSETETLIQQALDRLLAHRAALIIAHRLSTVRHAGAILVLNQGRIVETGTHDQLMARQGFYYNLKQVKD